MDREIFWRRVLLCDPACLEFLGWPWIHDLPAPTLWKLDYRHTIPCLAWMLSFKLSFVKLGSLLYLYELNMRLHVPYDSYEENGFALFSNSRCYWGSWYLQILKFLIAFNYFISCILHTSNPFFAPGVDFWLALFYFILLFAVGITESTFCYLAPLICV